jgi:hypothetical protein
MQRAPDCTEPGQKTVQPTKANDNKVDSLQWFKSFCSNLAVGGNTSGKTQRPVLALV